MKKEENDEAIFSQSNTRKGGVATQLNLVPTFGALLRR